MTAPRAYELGTVDKDYVLKRLNRFSNLLTKDSYNYIIQDHLNQSPDYTIGDVIFTMIEQKNIGVYQGDVKPDNIKYCSKKDICYFVDYDQATLLTEKIKKLPTQSFLRFCSKYDYKRYGFGNWERHFAKKAGFDSKNVISGQKLDLSNVKIFHNQNTTNTANGFYHSIDKEDLFLNANRNIKVRSEILNNISLERGEKVLDVGCNTGLLCEYLHDRGCEVTGFDIDERIIAASKIISNISSKKINYFVGDLDKIETLEKFDTIFLFSVFHHTSKHKQNGIKIADSCNRIIIETRPYERGSQPNETGQWNIVSGWKFNNVSELINFLEQTFVGFKLKKNHGRCDKNRYIIELIKEKSQ